MDYRSFSIEEFVADAYFQRWVLSEEETADIYWKKWLQDHPEQRQDILEAAAILRSMHFTANEPTEEDAAQVWRDIVKNRSTGRYKVKNQKIMAFPWYAVAASIALVLAVTFVMLKVQDVNHALFGISYQTEFGQTQELILPDGSSVVLGANSSLHYSSGWLGDSERTVSLEGEAYFSVVHTEDDQKFVVYSDEVAITVLGTRFNVNNRRDENQILLEEGSIRLSLPQAINKSEKVEVNMQPGELVSVQEGKITKAIAQTEKYISWTAGVFVFEKAPLSEVIELIEDHFGYTVITQGVEPEEMIMTAELRTTDLDMMLRYLSEIFQLKVEKTHETITLSST
ncbi:transmembrane sensor [Catalinimonas alkaloidigena]|uniref:FecR family protein n=1 Tax=Catalinimonas alkaloidigena TaxID=1075417 RepID=UPI0024058B91|nr:FecR domain-containing protein [Catalinimonas alkaloidigena]MDF9796252.1 transmembrane sensor [Catalinimonas alkaloidigena]